MKVLSLFDGISCGMAAFGRAKIPVERYAAFEIDKYAIKISKKNNRNNNVSFNKHTYHQKQSYTIHNPNYNSAY